ncbi:DNA repair protein rad14 [Batrachochytrium dendrobatidis]|nr:DNA repair protein rad14 [Batrachochytrium dendrobatidis]
MSNSQGISDEQLALIHANKQNALKRLRSQQNNQLNGSIPVSTHTRSGELAPSSALPAHTRKKKALDLTYCEFNLGTLKDTKGGFLPEPPVPSADNELMGGSSKSNTLNETPTSIYDHQIHPDPKENPQCSKCKSIDIDYNYEKHFKELVCRKCRDAYPDEYSLLTKTECREDYLLTESELRDSEKLPNWIKANPHKSTYSNMLLYLRKQVEAFAWSKWGSPEALDAEFVRRDAAKQVQKDKKFKKKLAELRAKTRTSVWERNRKTEHDHTYGEEVYDEAKGIYVRTCSGCAMQLQYEDL